MASLGPERRLTRAHCTPDWAQVVKAVFTVSSQGSGTTRCRGGFADPFGEVNSPLQRQITGPPLTAMNSIPRRAGAMVSKEGMGDPHPA
jgi:hypothetical protein